MKTVFINASPKPWFSASSYFLKLLRLLVQGDTVSVPLRNKHDSRRILEELPDADIVVLCLPLYVDGAPSHVLSFLKEMERACERRTSPVHVYCIANNGFIEGRQNGPLMQIIRNFCARSGLNWCGGVGIGGGVMLNITQILFAVNGAVFCLKLIQNGIQRGALIDPGTVGGFLVGALILVFLNLGAWVHLFQMSRAINKGRGRYFGERYTRILLPSSVFILIADLFFAVTSVFRGGVFRGWLSKK
ncbi:MAG: hypothetical protein LIO42_00730 [Oscillospiraceae bacterium]|nr:hypothetical protein [Oscillospiraceae bacterium]